MHGIPKGKKRVINRENLIQQVILGGIIVACFVYSFVSDSLILKILSGIAFAIVGTIIISYYSIEFFSGPAYAVASAINEFIYHFIGIPILVVAAGFLPVSFIVAFLKPDSRYVTIAIFVIVGVLEVTSIAYIITRYLRDKNMNLIQYFKHIFDFRRRASEQQKFKERKDQIDTFYDDLYKVEHKIAKKMEEKSSGFEQFDWKERVGQIGAKTVKGIKCWNCNKQNDEDAYFCQSCSAPLRKEE